MRRRSLEPLPQQQRGNGARNGVPTRVGRSLSPRPSNPIAAASRGRQTLASAVGNVQRIVYPLNGLNNQDGLPNSPPASSAGGERISRVQRVIGGVFGVAANPKAVGGGSGRQYLSHAGNNNNNGGSGFRRAANIHGVAGGGGGGEGGINSNIASAATWAQAYQRSGVAASSSNQQHHQLQPQPQSQSQSQQRSPTTAAISGMTRSEITAAKTPELASRLQAELGGLSRRVAEDSPQHLHSVRQIDDMVAEVLARWRKSTTLALSSIDSLESEVARKTEAISELSTRWAARTADKDAAIASTEAEKEALRIYAQRLELHLGKMIEAAASIGANDNNDDNNDVGEEDRGEGEDGGRNGGRRKRLAGNHFPTLPAPLAAALKNLLAAAHAESGSTTLGLGGSSSSSAGVSTTTDYTVNASSTRGAAQEVEGLKAAVREGSDNVLQFFAELDANYPPRLHASAASTRHQSANHQHEAVPTTSPSSAFLSEEMTVSPTTTTTTTNQKFEQSLKNVDATLRRALKFSGVSSPTATAANLTAIGGIDSSSSSSSSSPTIRSGSASKGNFPSLSRFAAAAAVGAGIVVANGSSANGLSPFSATTFDSATMGISPPPPASKSKSKSFSSSSVAAVAGETTRIASLEVEFDPAMHAKATVAQLKAAVAIKAGAKPLSLRVAGKALLDDTAKLVDIGVPVKATIEVMFVDKPGGNKNNSVKTNNNNTSSSSSSSSSMLGGATTSTRPPIAPTTTTTSTLLPPALHVPRPANPLSIPSKLSPPFQKRPLMSPAPHRAPLELSGTVKETKQRIGADIKEQKEEEEGVTNETTDSPLGFRTEDVVIVEEEEEDDDAHEEQQTETEESATKSSSSTSSDSLPTTLSLRSPGKSSSSSISSSSSVSSPALRRAESARILSLAQDKSGRVTGSVLHTALAHPSQGAQREAILRSIFHTIDVDGSNSLTLDELDGYVQSIRKKLLTTPSSSSSSSSPAASAKQNIEETETEAFDGVPLALHAAFCALLEESGSLASTFLRLDANGDGTVDFQEFLVLGEEMFTGNHHHQQQQQQKTQQQSHGGAAPRVDAARKAALDRNEKLQALEAAKIAAKQAEEAAKQAMAKVAADVAALEEAEMNARAAAAAAVLETEGGSNKTTNDSNEAVGFSPGRRGRHKNNNNNVKINGAGANSSSTEDADDLQIDALRNFSVLKRAQQQQEETSVETAGISTTTSTSASTHPHHHHHHRHHHHTMKPKLKAATPPSSAKPEKIRAAAAANDHQKDVGSDTTPLLPVAAASTSTASFEHPLTTVAPDLLSPRQPPPQARKMTPLLKGHPPLVVQGAAPPPPPPPPSSTTTQASSSVGNSNNTNNNNNNKSGPPKPPPPPPFQNGSSNASAWKKN